MPFLITSDDNLETFDILWKHLMTFGEQLVTFVQHFIPFVHICYQKGLQMFPKSHRMFPKGQTRSMESSHLSKRLSNVSIKATLGFAAHVAWCPTSLSIGAGADAQRRGFCRQRH